MLRAELLRFLSRRVTVPADESGIVPQVRKIDAVDPFAMILPEVAVRK
jgi:hypothetical protein